MQLINRIVFAQFSNDSTIFVCYTDKSKSQIDEQFYYDVWLYNKNDNSWVLSKSDLTNKISINKDDKIEREHINRGLVTNYTISNGKILCVRYLSIDLNDIDFSKTTYNELWKMNKEYISKNNLRLSLFIYTIK